MKLQKTDDIIHLFFAVCKCFSIIHEKLEYLAIWVYHNTDNKKFV